MCACADGCMELLHCDLNPVNFSLNIHSNGIRQPYMCVKQKDELNDLLVCACVFEGGRVDGVSGLSHRKTNTDRVT